MKLVSENLSLSKPVAAKDARAFGFLLPEGLANMYRILKIDRDPGKDYDLVSRGATIIAKADEMHYEVSDGLIIPRYVTFAAEPGQYRMKKAN